MTRHPSRAALCFVALFVVGAGAHCASAGPVLLTRESDIRASGATAAGEYLLSNGSADFAPFTDGLLSDAALPARSSAQQHSEPRLDSAGVLSGASAEGSARASVDAGADDAFSDAETGFDLVFRVDGAPATFTFDGSLAASGDATTGLLLHDKLDPAAAPVIAIDVTEQDQVVRQATVLEPGTYGLSVWAFARGTPAESAASYLVSVSLEDGELGAVPMPLPVALWGGAAGLSAVALLTYRRRAVKMTSRE